MRKYALRVGSAGIRRVVILCLDLSTGFQQRLGKTDLNTFARYADSPRMETNIVPEQLSLQTDDQISTAPFADRETDSHWTIEGRAVEGPLKSNTLAWLPGVQCKWFARSAEYPNTEIYSARSGELAKGVVHSEPEIMGGTPVFVGARVPLQNLIDYFEGGESIEDFLDGFPSVKREQVIAVIEAGKLQMLETV